LDSVQSNALKDVFGFELRYNEQEAGLSNEARYNGNISAIVWKAENQLSDQQPVRTRSYTFAYDDMGRLLSADFRGYENGTWTAEADAYDVNGLSYDANGNIESLTRYAQLSDTAAAAKIDELSYTYEAGSNRLQTVSDASGSGKGFIDGASLSSEYTYDNDGNLTRDENKDIDITYNILSKTATVVSDSATVTYIYSATGQRLQERVKINSDSTIIRDMIGGLVWESKEGLTPKLSYLPMPEGRLVKQDSTFRYEYFYTDHQGNTRVSWTPAEGSQSQHTLTMESGANEEGDYPRFKNVAAFRDGTQALSGSSSAKVTNATGPYISIPVMKGDTIDASVYYFYDDQSTSSSSQQMLTQEKSSPGSNNDFTFMAPLITTSPRIPGTGDREALGGKISLNLAALYPIGKALFGKKNESTSNLSISENTLGMPPAAYLELLLYDKDSSLVSSQAVPVGSSTFWSQIDGTLTASVNGYIVVQLRSQDTQDVWFDDLQIDHRKPDRAVVLQENHYYPFGLQMEGVAVNTALPTDPNRKLYNASSDWQKETGLYSTQYREYDPALGRFHAIDPMAGSFATWTPYMYGYNDPVNANDPTGLYGQRVSVAQEMAYRNSMHDVWQDPGSGAL
ncbi:MAG: RHS repeat-associated core domain-containing protein, partial [Cyclobacteriaceae bacterium]